VILITAVPENLVFINFFFVLGLTAAVSDMSKNTVR